MSTRFAGFKNFSQGLLFITLIIMGIIFVGFIVISIIGNISLSCQNKEIKLPDINNAQYRIDIKALRKSYFSDHYELINGNTYYLDGYWELRNGKYIYNPSNIYLDTHYFGDIRVTKR